MATLKTLDHLTCTTASEAFKHPLPQVRQFHRTLTAELDEKNVRLRNIVGGSYRQLLGTAEMILQMKHDIGDADEKLARVGRGCGRAVVSHMVGGLARFHERDGDADGGRREEFGWLARLKVLSMCALNMARMLRSNVREDHQAEYARGKTLIIAAKVWVLGRLLAKSLSDESSEKMLNHKHKVEELRKKLGSLKRRLLRAVERTLTKSGGLDNRDDLVQALCAYSLATNSGARDVLRYFLRVRGEAIVLSFEDEMEYKQDEPAAMKALYLYTRTLIDVQALVPRRLSEALLQLKSKALLRDSSLWGLEILRLDVCEKWFTDEILNFTPYIKHDDLDGPQAVETLNSWANQASGILFQGLERSLQTIAELKHLVDLRTKILEVWIKEGGKAKGMNPSVTLDGLRKAITGRLIALLEARVDKLHLLGTEIEATLGGWQTGITDKYESLWDEHLLNMDISNGAIQFKQSLLHRVNGRNDAVSRAFMSYQTWRHLVDEIITVLSQLRKQKWDEDLDDLEDDDGVSFRSAALSQDDPKMLQDHLDSSLQIAYENLDDRLKSLIDTYGDDEHSGPISIYMLRILRDIRAGLPQGARVQSFGLSLVPQLHETLISSVSAGPLENFEKHFRRKKVAGRMLWEGSPELPVQPSPATFKFLYGVTLSMAHAGGDLWTSAASELLKIKLRSELGRKWHLALVDLQEKEKLMVNGTLYGSAESKALSDDTIGGEETDKERRKDVLIQALFDILVLQSALELHSAIEGDSLNSLRETVESRIALETSIANRLRGSAKEYWKKTSLLFGLLA